MPYHPDFPTDLLEAALRMAAASLISTMKVLRPAKISSLTPILWEAKKLSLTEVGMGLTSLFGLG